MTDRGRVLERRKSPCPLSSSPVNLEGGGGKDNVGEGRYVDHQHNPTGRSAWPGDRGCLPCCAPFPPSLASKAAEAIQPKFHTCRVKRDERRRRLGWTACYVGVPASPCVCHHQPRRSARSQAAPPGPVVPTPQGQLLVVEEVEGGGGNSQAFGFWAGKIGGGGGTVTHTSQTSGSAPEPSE